MDAEDEPRQMDRCSPYKLVPQSMIANVMAVCPDVDPKDVAKDLIITGSATRTINRILDGQVSKTFCSIFVVLCVLMQSRPERAAEIEYVILLKIY